MRFLLEWRDPHRQGSARPETQGLERRHSRVAFERALPLLRPHQNSARHKTLPGKSGGNEAGMRSDLTRRDFLKTSGALIVTFSAAAAIGPFAAAQGPFDTHASHI